MTGTQIASGLLNTAAALALVPLASNADIGAFGTGFGEPLVLAPCVLLRGYDGHTQHYKVSALRTQMRPVSC